MNKVHWNTLFLEQLPANLISELVNHSYELVVSKLTKKQKAALESMI
jgi:predicted DNA-binding protein (MmcQ/YjbR family)